MRASRSQQINTNSYWVKDRNESLLKWNTAAMNQLKLNNVPIITWQPMNHFRLKSIYVSANRVLQFHRLKTVTIIITGSTAYYRPWSPQKTVTTLALNLTSRRFDLSPSMIQIPVQKWITPICSGLSVPTLNDNLLRWKRSSFVHSPETYFLPAGASLEIPQLCVPTPNVAGRPPI